MQKIDRIYVHHTGGVGSNLYAPSSDVPIETHDAAHKIRWLDFQSRLGWWLGYNIFVRKDGIWTQTRLIGEETAAQRGRNFDSVSICLAGNFDLNLLWKPVESPTKEQVDALRTIEVALVEGTWRELGIRATQDTVVSIPLQNIFPHRMNNPTACYGYSLSNWWARDLVVDFLKYKLTLLQRILLLLTALQRRMSNSFGANQLNSPGCKPERG